MAHWHADRKESCRGRKRLRERLAYGGTTTLPHLVRHVRNVSSMFFREHNKDAYTAPHVGRENLSDD